MALWKARGRLLVLIELFSPALAVEALWADIGRNCGLQNGVGVSQISWQGGSSSNDFWRQKITLSQKTCHLKLSVNLSNLDRFSKLSYWWKSYKICYKTIRHHPPHLRHVATLPWEIKNLNFLPIFNRCGRKCKHFECTDYNSSTRPTVNAECIYVLTQYLKHWNIQRHSYFLRQNVGGSQKSQLIVVW